MNRRKFLSVGGIGLLGVNSLVYGMSPNLLETGEGLADTFVTWLGGKEIAKDIAEPLTSKVHESIRELLVIGYQLNTRSMYSTFKFHVVCLTLKNKQTVLDEVVVVFDRSEKMNKTGLLNAQQLNWYLANAERINQLAIESNNLTEDWVLPATSKRFFENGTPFFSTRKGQVGFRTDIEQAGTAVLGSIRDDNGKTLIEARCVSAGFYPENNYI